MEYRMLTEARSDESKAIRRKMMKQGRDFSPRRGKVLVPREDDLVQAITTSLTNDHYLLAIPRSIRMQYKSTNGILKELKTMETSQKSTQNNSPTLIALLEASLARLSASPESGPVLRIPEGRYSLTLREYCEQNNLDYSSLKMLKGFSATTVDALLLPSSPRLQSWGTMPNGKLLTAKIMESHKIENALSLSDILEVQPDPKYFLSAEATERL